MRVTTAEPRWRIQRTTDLTSYFIRRLLLVIPTFLGITLLVFAVTRVVPGGPIERAMNEALLAQTDSAVTIDMNSIGGAALSEDQLAELRAYYGFDKPWYESYVIWLGRVLKLDLGTSTRYTEPVWDIIKKPFSNLNFLRNYHPYSHVRSLYTVGHCQSTAPQQYFR